MGDAYTSSQAVDAPAKGRPSQEGVRLATLVAERSSRRDDEDATVTSILTVDAPPEANSLYQGVAMRELMATRRPQDEGPAVVPKGPDGPTARRPDESTAIGNHAYRTATIGVANDVDSFLENEIKAAPPPPKKGPRPSRAAAGPAPKLSSGFEWLKVAMPSLAAARKALPPSCVSPEALAAFAALPPLVAYQQLHDLSIVPQLGVSSPLPASGHESPDETALRSNAQRRCRSYILPKAANETAEMFALRVNARKPRAPSKPIKPPCLVFAYQSQETAADFDARMEAVVRISVPVLPRGAAESREDYHLRLEALQEAGAQFNSLPRTTLPPLVLPKSKAEDPKAFARRLRLALEPTADGPLCPIILPRAFREEESDAERRLGLQLRLPAECLLPYDALAETEEEYIARLDAAEARLPTSRTRERATSSFASGLGSLRGSLSNTLARSARWLSLKAGSAKRSMKEQGSDKAPTLATIQSSGATLGEGSRNQLLQDNDDDAVCCGCLLSRPRR